MIKKSIKTTIRLLKQPSILMRKSTVPFNTRVGSNVIIHNSKIGKYCYIADRITIKNTVMGNYCSIAPGVIIGGMEHSWWWWSTSTRLSSKSVSSLKTTISDDVWIGANVIVRQGVTIGRGAVISAGSVVLRDVLPYSIVGGIPAKELKNRFSKDIIDKIEATKYWSKSPSEAKLLLEQIDDDYKMPSYLIK